MKFRIIVEYEYPVEHKTPVKAELVLHGDIVTSEKILPLPKGHGDLALVEIPYGINGCNSCPMHERLWCCVTKECDVAHEEMSVIGRHNCCPVIKVIEADKEGAEE